jgi:hypothetical protein
VSEMGRNIGVGSGNSGKKSKEANSEVKAILPERGSMTRDEQNSRDLAILNRRAKRLNQEALDVLSYQVDLCGRRRKT